MSEPKPLCRACGRTLSRYEAEEGAFCDLCWNDAHRKPAPQEPSASQKPGVFVHARSTSIFAPKKPLTLLEAADRVAASTETLRCIGNPLGAEVLALREENARLRDALLGIVELGKRDLSNPKYDGYFDAARAALERTHE